MGNRVREDVKNATQLCLRMQECRGDSENKFLPQKAHNDEQGTKNTDPAPAQMRHKSTQYKGALGR